MSNPTPTPTPLRPPSLQPVGLSRAAKIAISFTIPSLFGILIVAFIIYRWRSKSIVPLQPLGIEAQEIGAWNSGVPFNQYPPSISVVPVPYGGSAEVGAAPPMPVQQEFVGFGAQNHGQAQGLGVAMPPGGDLQVLPVAPPTPRLPAPQKYVPTSPVRRKPVPVTPPATQSQLEEDDEEMRWLREEQERVKERRERLKKLEQLDDQELQIKQRIWEKSSQQGGRAL